MVRLLLSELGTPPESFRARTTRRGHDGARRAGREGMADCPLRGGGRDGPTPRPATGRAAGPRPDLRALGWQRRAAAAIRGDDRPTGPLRAVAHLAALFDHLGGPQAAVAAVRQRAGGQLDPALGAVFSEHGPALLAEVANGDAWAAVLAAEPSPQRLLSESQLDEAARAFADMVDLKLPFTRGHSAGVAALAEAAARGLGLTETEVVAVRRAGLLHDLGRVASPNGVWEKPGPLTRGEWEQVRLHPYHSERILACFTDPRAAGPDRRDAPRAPGRLGLPPPGARAATVPLGARLLAAADAYHAMTEPRPHRPALTAADAAELLRAEAAAWPARPRCRRRGAPGRRARAGRAAPGVAGRAERPRSRGVAADRARRILPRGGAATSHLPEDGRTPRRAHLQQDRRVVARRRRHVRDGARSPNALTTCTATAEWGKSPMRPPRPCPMLPSASASHEHHTIGGKRHGTLSIAARGHG